MKRQPCCDRARTAKFTVQFAKSRPRTKRCAMICGLLLSLFLATGLPSSAQAKYASLVIDAKTGEVLHEINADTRNYPASLTKMMTLYMMFDAIDAGHLRKNDHITMSRRAASQPPSKLGIAPGKTMSVETAIRALAIKSANDVAAAVAEHIGGTERNFALMMTAKARQIGMSSTTFRNASGLPHSGQLSTARDMSKLAHALLTHFPHHYHYFSQPNFRHGNKTYRSHNSLLTNYEGTDGIKTGYIRASGFNLVASVKRGNTRLIGVVFGAQNSKTRNRHMVKLLDKGWEKLDPTMTVAQKTETENKPKGKAVWGIQVGAFKTYNPAYEVAMRAIGLAPSYLSSGDIAVTPLQKKSGDVLYRGRVMGISKSQAYRACRFLEKRKMGCMPLKTTEPFSVASLN